MNKIIGKTLPPMDLNRENNSQLARSAIRHMWSLRYATLFGKKAYGRDITIAKASDAIKAPMKIFMDNSFIHATLPREKFDAFEFDGTMVDDVHYFINIVYPEMFELITTLKEADFAVYKKIGFSRDQQGKTIQDRKTTIYPEMSVKIMDCAARDYYFKNDTETPYVIMSPNPILADTIIQLTKTYKINTILVVCKECPVSNYLMNKFSHVIDLDDFLDTFGFRSQRTK